MSDGLTVTSTRDSHPARHAAPRRARVAVLQAGGVVAVFAAVGLFAGWLWHELWPAPVGVAAGGEWFTDESGLRADFSGVGWYVTVATLGGALLGALAAWLSERAELLTLAAVLVGSVLAGYLMYAVGTHLSPPDPRELAATAPDGTELPGALRVPSWPPRGAFPFGALLGLAVVYAASARRTAVAPAERSVESGPDAGTRG